MKINTQPVKKLPGIMATSIRALLVALLPFVTTSTPVLAVDAVWLFEPGSGDWNTGTNWSTSPTAPVNPGDTATFNTSTQTSLTLHNVTVESITFNSGASAFTITTPFFSVLTIQGAGIVNNSGQRQTFINGGTPFHGPGGVTQFLNTSTAGNATIINSGPRGEVSGGVTDFFNTSTAGSATINNNVGGETDFFNASTAGSATINNFEAATDFFNTSTAGSATINNYGSSPGGGSGLTFFQNTSTAGNATIINSGGAFVAGIAVGMGGSTVFQDTSTAGSATITNNGGTDGGTGGGTFFFDGSDGGTARAITNGNGTFDISGLTTAGMGIGSIEGSGNYFLGSKTLTVGGNNLSTTVSGVIQDGGDSGGVGGSLAKIGTGTLTLTGTNTYSGGTNLNGGILAISSDANLGTGALSFNGGTLEALTAGGGLVSAKAITLNVGGGTFLADAGTNSTLNGMISGVGSLTKNGLGTLTLTGTNTYSGGTNLNGGILAISSDANLGTGALSFNGGTLEALTAGGGLVSSKAITLNVGGGTFLADAGTSSTLEGGISGIGSLTKAGLGTLVLMGVNAYAGGTTISTGTLQLGNGGTTGSITGNVTNNGILAFDRSDAPTFAGVISGLGSVAQIGTGTTILTGNNTYTGGTTISAGALQLGNGGTTGSITGNVTDNGILAFDRSDAVTFGGVIGGIGSLVDLGGGTLTLTGNNTYAGGTTINAGALQLGAGGTTGSIVGNVIDNGVLIFSRSDAVNFGGVISGTGDLVKLGGGTLTLTGINTYTGTTTVNAGSLIVDGSIASAQTLVNAGGLLGGHGSLGGSLVNSGIVSPGDSPGTLTVNNNYIQNAGGTLRIEVAGLAPSQHDLLAVNGHASLAGTLQLIGLGGFTLHVGDQLTFLTANGGVSGSFGTVQNQFATGTLVNGEVVDLPNAVVLEGTQGSFANTPGVATTPNEVAVAKALDSAIGDPREAALFAFLDSQPLANLPHDLALIAPEEVASIFDIGVSVANVQTANLKRRMEDIRAGSTGSSAAGFTLNGSAPSSGGLAGVTGPEGKGRPSALTPTPENRWGVWVTGIGEFTNVDSTENAAGYYLETGGLTLGVDYRVSSYFAIGLTAGYAHTNADLANGGNLDVNAGNLGLYATVFGNGFYLDTAVTGGPNGYNTRRTALLGSANGNTDGGDFNVLVSGGYDWKKGGLTIGPTANFQFTYVGFSSFTESGSLAPLKFPSQNAESERTAFGMKASYDWKVGHVIIKPEISLAWQHEYGDQAYSIISSFASGAGNSFTVNGPKVGRDSLLIGAGAAVLLSDRISIYAYYDDELGRTNYQSNNVSAGVRVTF